MEIKCQSDTPSSGLRPPSPIEKRCGRRDLNPPFTVLITGSSRGIGLELARQYAAAGWRVLASCRQPESAISLHTLAAQFPDLSIHPLDVIVPEQVAALAKTLSKMPIDVLILNAGIVSREDHHYSDIRRELLEQLYLTNTIAPVEIAKTFISQVEMSRQKKIIYISSNLASIHDNISGGFSYSYRASKAAGNCLMKNLAFDVQAQGIQVLVVHPGWVRTDMGGTAAPLSVAESVRGIRQVIATVTETGTFYAYDGKVTAW